MKVQKPFLFCFIMFIMHSALSDVAKIAVHVLDDVTGEPVEGVNVVANFKMDNGILAWKGNAFPDIHRIVTDKNGNGSAVGRTNVGQAGCYLQYPPPAGYYMPRRGSGYTFTSKNIFGVWQPEDQVVTVRLQRVECPIPLMVKQVEGHGEDIFEKCGGRIAFDFLKGDWLPPIGDGEVADAVFTRLPHEELGEGENLGRKGRSYRDSMAVEFPGGGNGLIEIATKDTDGIRIRTAPTGGYQHGRTFWYGRDSRLRLETSYDENRCFCFRIRTKMDQSGEITEALYGKIYGDIKFCGKSYGASYVPVAAVQMRYYLNPTPLDRNLEWNMHNLCKAPGDLHNPER